MQASTSHYSPTPPRVFTPGVLALIIAALVAGLLAPIPVCNGQDPTSPTTGNDTNTSTPTNTTTDTNTTNTNSSITPPPQMMCYACTNNPKSSIANYSADCGQKDDPTNVAICTMNGCYYQHVKDKVEMGCYDFPSGKSGVSRKECFEKYSGVKLKKHEKLKEGELGDCKSELTDGPGWQKFQKCETESDAERKQKHIIASELGRNIRMKFCYCKGSLCNNQSLINPSKTDPGNEKNKKSSQESTMHSKMTLPVTVALTMIKLITPN